MQNKQIDFKKIRRVLVAKLRHHGDVLLSSPLFSVLKRHFPHLEIDAYLYEETLPMLSGHPAIANYVICDRKWKQLPFYRRLKKELELLYRIRKRGYDLVINLTEGDRGALAARVSRCQYAVGYDPMGKGMWRKKEVFTHLVDHGPYPRHTVEKNLDALRCLGLFPKLSEREIFFHLPHKALDQAEKLLSTAGLQIGEYVHIHPVSRWMFKSLSTQTIAKVIEGIDQRGKKVVLTASRDPIEKAFNAQVCREVPSIPVLDLSGQLSLKELAAIIAHSALLISVDSVTVHLSSALKKKVVAIFGPTCEKNWAPWGHFPHRVVTPNVSCRPCYRSGCGGGGISDCLISLPPAKILEATWELLDELEIRENTMT